MTDVPAHDQKVTHSYVVHYPAHAPRTGDPNYVDFEHFHQEYGPTARCTYALHATLPGDADPVLTGRRLIGPGETRAGCDTTSPMELHHAHIEFALQNGVDLALLEKDYPGVSNPNEVGAWIESGANFEWFCTWHHRGQGGAHSAAASDFEAEKYVLSLIANPHTESTSVSDPS
jgi:hypothetical protein